MRGRSSAERKELRRALAVSGRWPAQLAQLTMPLANELLAKLGKAECYGLAELVHELIETELQRQRATKPASLRKLA